MILVHETVSESLLFKICLRFNKINVSEKVLYLTCVINYDKQEISFPIQIQIQKIFGKKRK